MIQDHSWCMKETKESTLGKDSSVPLMHHDPSDLGSLIIDPRDNVELTLLMETVRYGRKLRFALISQTL